MNDDKLNECQIWWNENWSVLKKVNHNLFLNESFEVDENEI